MLLVPAWRAPLGLAPSLPVRLAQVSEGYSRRAISSRGCCPGLGLTLVGPCSPVLVARLTPPRCLPVLVVRSWVLAIWRSKRRLTQLRGLADCSVVVLEATASWGCLGRATVR